MLLDANSRVAPIAVDVRDAVPPTIRWVTDYILLHDNNVLYIVAGFVTDIQPPKPRPPKDASRTLVKPSVTPW